MKGRYILGVVASLISIYVHAPAATRYVDLNSTNPVSPYADWSTAATNIQDAVDSSTNGDLILVTNGVYQFGGRLSSDGQSNRVIVSDAVTLQSVNGHAATVIDGGGVMRCVRLAGGATLAGFTITNGNAGGGSGMGGGVLASTNALITNCVLTANSAGWYGGGAYGGTINNCTLTGNYGSLLDTYGGGAAKAILNNCLLIHNRSDNVGGGTYQSTLNDCVLRDNSATNSGGGSYQGTLNNCVLVGNSAASAGGGAYQGTLTSCTLTSNSAPSGGGVSGGNLTNCIVYYNSGNHTALSPMYYCCTTPLPYGVGNITNEPLFVNPAAGDFHLQSNSPCINSGSNAYVVDTTDLDGKARIVNGTVDIGAYEYQGSVRYVNLNSTNPIAPYSDWSIAATNIQDAVDASVNGDTILVSNGIYQVGGRLSSDGVSNRVFVTDAVMLQSVNGRDVTMIDGGGLMRCVYLTNGAILSGFTITNGNAVGYGGGIYCVPAVTFEPNSNALIENCLVISNRSSYGGGVIYGSVSNCSLSWNTSTSSGGGAEQSVLDNCVLSNNAAAGGVRDYGGGASTSTLNNCIVWGNFVSTFGGGTFECVMNNCLVVSNNSDAYGGGAEACILNGCTVVGNFAKARGGGIDESTGFAGYSLVPVANNCIVYYNSAGAGYPDIFLLGSKSNNNCCTPQPVIGPGNITNDPTFVDLSGRNYHLQSDSLCINSGNNAYVNSATDLDGNPRIAGGTVDIGAYEYQSPVSQISYAWLQQYGLPIIASIDTFDLDGTGFTVYQDWIAGLNPTNALSVLMMLPLLPTNNPTGLVVSWESVSNRTYFLQSGTNLGMQPAFSTIQSNILGSLTGTNRYTDTSATNGGPYFYRVGVQQ